MKFLDAVKNDDIDALRRMPMRLNDEARHVERQLAMPNIPPPPPPPEQYLLAQIRDAYLILQRLNISFESKLPNNVYMALAHLHIEIIARTTPGKEVSCNPNA